ncbi:uncharacterized protein C7orf50 homolog isoform X3 [Zalophus californianus]|uniref:Uncharacterized protein C7orf50 homolog isoform X3 n=1 Tax=Zalophus californianus TaxID=9704 RepID=A0A6J2EK67_ZALCA|nr:uncharacterized protein C7orf50 homolog isoform X3 [Zalophus californianus]XP_027947660.1 uncharacterized protein C7orf50 homolog isoform X2 [Eumetopias jubatus]
MGSGAGGPTPLPGLHRPGSPAWRPGSTFPTSWGHGAPCAPASAFCTGEAVLGARQETAPQLPALTPEEKRVLERKLKKERRKEERKWLRESGAAQSLPAKRSGAQLALDYLCGWAEKHENWRFQKTRQTWLLMHMYDSDQVPDALFSTLLAYLEGLRGRARELTVQKAEALMQEVDKASGAEPLPLGKTQRIRRVLQLLS